MATWSRPSGPSRSASATARRPRATSTAGCAVRVYEPSPKHEVISFDQLNTWYYADAPKRDPARSSRSSGAASTFDEVVGGLDESNALYEARRCMSCGNCFSCDNCFGVCPDNAVIKLAEAAENPNVNGYAIDLDFCKGCGLCVQECPCGAIEMVPEKI